MTRVLAWFITLLIVCVLVAVALWVLPALAVMAALASILNWWDRRY